MQWVIVISIIVVFMVGSVWAYYKYLQALSMTGKPYKLGGNTLTFVFTLPLSFIIAGVIKGLLTKKHLSDGFALDMIFILMIVISNYLICIISTSLAKRILKSKGKL